MIALILFIVVAGILVASTWNNLNPGEVEKEEIKDEVLADVEPPAKKPVRKTIRKKKK